MKFGIFRTKRTVCIRVIRNGRSVVRILVKSLFAYDPTARKMNFHLNLVQRHRTSASPHYFVSFKLT